MEVSFGASMTPWQPTSDPLIVVQDAIDEYLVDPALSVSDMMEQYNVATTMDRGKRAKKELFCTVCHASASGFNFDQITCESCKAFFRRNALKDIKESQCRFGGACNITIETRRHCSYCRIKKCFDVGMRKEWIRSEIEKQNKHSQLQNHRRRKTSQDSSKISPGSHPALSSSLSILSSSDRTRLSNITHCFDQFSGEPSALLLSRVPKIRIVLRVDEFYNRKRPIFVNLITYFKHLPELQAIDVDDQVRLIKQNIRLLVPLNYAILRTSSPTFTVPNVETIGCLDNINLHHTIRLLGDLFDEFAVRDQILVKLFISVLFFTTNPVTTRSIYDPGQYERVKEIRQIQSSYLELLWLYMLEKCGERTAVHLLTKMVTRYLHVQLTIDQIDSIIRVNEDVDKIDALMQTILQLT